RLLGGVDFKDFFISLSGQSYPTLAAAKAAAAPTLNYGLFLNAVINFLIVSFAIFMLVRQVNRLFPKPAAPTAPQTKDCAWCATLIPLAAKRCPHCTSSLAGCALRRPARAHWPEEVTPAGRAIGRCMIRTV